MISLARQRQGHPFVAVLPLRVLRNERSKVGRSRILVYNEDTKFRCYRSKTTGTIQPAARWRFSGGRHAITVDDS